jgi:hypothetical protein
MTDTFHQTTVASDDIGVVIRQLIAEASSQMTFGQSQADSIGETLAEWTSCDFDTSSVTALGVTRRC